MFYRIYVDLDGPERVNASILWCFIFLMIVLSISPLTNKKYLNFVHFCKYPVAQVCTCYFFRFFQVQLSYTRYTINNGRNCSVKNCVHKNKSIACTHALIIILNNKHMRVGVLFLGAVLPVNQSFIFLRLNGFYFSRYRWLFFKCGSWVAKFVSIV